ncbi:MAG TPA: inositol monophosphatase family protein [Nitrososphaerales archaeon]|nr:inositol monophosphatase family protein [Nitrososphaerales archaeon]
MKPAIVDWERLLLEATEKVQLTVQAGAGRGNRGEVVGVGASGDKTIVADKKAEDVLIGAIAKVQGVRVLSEEAGQVGDSKGKLLAIIDPIDGSSNFERGIPFYCTSVAIADGSSHQDIFFGIVRNLVSGEAYTATRGKGARKNGKKIRTSEISELSKAVAGIDISRASRGTLKGLLPLMGRISRQVHYGANALELCLMAEGKTDAFVDLRGRMRTVDFAAAQLIASEAGGVVSSPEGDDLRFSMDLQSRFSFVASSNKELHRNILECLGKDKFPRRNSPV